MPGKSKKGGGLESSPVYKKSPTKFFGLTQSTGLQRDPHDINEWSGATMGVGSGVGAFKLKSGNTTPFKQMGSSPAKQVTGRGRVPGTKPWGNIRPFAPEVTKTLSKVGKFARGSSLAGAVYGLFKGYGKLAKTKHGKEIIKQSGVGRTRKI